MFYRAPGLAAFALFLTFAGCSRQAIKPELDRTAVLRFENQGLDPASDWVGRAIPLILDAELSGIANLAVIGTPQLHVYDAALGARPISAPGISAERSQALVAGATRLAYGNYSVRGSRLYVHLWLEDLRTQKIIKVAEVSAAANDAIGAATALARQLSLGAAAYPTRSDACIRAYAQGLESNDVGRAVARMEEAIAADPDFGPAYRSLAELDIQVRNREGAIAVLERALARGGMAPIERARIQLDAAVIRNDPAARQQALAALAKFEPGNVNTWQTLAQTALARRDYAAAIDAYRRAIAIEPQNTSLLNEFGYAATYGGRFEEGIAAVQKYRALRPTDPNALDSLGDLNLIANHYREAEDFYRQASKIDPKFNNNSDLFKTALARAMTGDLAGADDLYKQYIAARTVGHDTNAAFLHGEWLWLTGRRKQAMGELQTFARTADSRHDRVVASHAYAGIAIWELMAGDRPAAQTAAQQAVSLSDPATAGASVISRFLSQSSASPEEWQTRADRFVPNPAQNALKNEMLAWALLFDHQFEAAKVPLQKMYDVGGAGSNEGAPVLLAWCDVETGNLAAAAPLLALTPAPPTTGVSTFMPLWFPRLFELRATVAAKAGKAEEAKGDLDIFHKLSGS